MNKNFVSLCVLYMLLHHLQVIHACAIQPEIKLTRIEQQQLQGIYEQFQREDTQDQARNKNIQECCDCFWECDEASTCKIPLYIICCPVIAAYYYHKKEEAIKTKQQRYKIVAEKASIIIAARRQLPIDHIVEINTTDQV